MKLWLEKIRLNLKVNWKLSRSQTTFKENFIVYLDNAGKQYRSEIAPNLRYGETPDNILGQFESWPEKKNLNLICDELTLQEALSDISLHSLRFGLESVFLSFLADQAGVGLSNYLNLPPVKIAPTSFSMPIIPVDEIPDYLAPLKRFESLKIKVNADMAMDMLKEIKRHSSAKLRIDANEAWTDFDSFMRFHENLKNFNVELIEQPFPSVQGAEYRELKKRTPYTILADESIEDVADFTELARQFHAVNIKLMKTGSLLKARNLLLEAQAHHMQAMIGCMIETTLGISYGMLFTGMVRYIDLDGFLLVKNEPFHLVEENLGNLFLKESVD
jgi:L-alanine-DL-glutamate epimerase-like enolase superfamily enzyme